MQKSISSFKYSFSCCWPVSPGWTHGDGGGKKVAHCVVNELRRTVFLRTRALCPLIFSCCLSTSLSYPPICHASQHMPWLSERWWISQRAHAGWPAGCCLLERTRIWIITAFASPGSANLSLHFPPCPQFAGYCQLEGDSQVLHISTFVVAEYRSLSGTSCQFFTAFTRN